jgi:hypothetical protein
MKTQQKKYISNLSTKRSTLKPCNSKTSPMTPGFLYDFQVLLKVEIKNTLPKKININPNVRSDPL